MKLEDLEYNLTLLKLSPEEEVQYAFLKTIQNKLLSVDFMRAYEDQLYQKKLTQFNQKAKNFHPEEYIFSIKTFSKEVMDPEHFKTLICRDYVEPFVVKGFLDDTPALKKWSVKFFRDNYPDANVAYGRRDSTGIETDGLFGKMGDLCRRIQSPKDETIYINNTAQIFKDYPELLHDLGHERLKALYDPIAVNVILQLFMGGPKTGVDLHCANEFNSFLMVQGKKRWTFISYDYSYALRGVLSVNALNAVCEIQDHKKDFDYYEQNFPLYNRIPKLVVDIEPGDMLVFSPWWWHAIENTTEYSIAVATRWTAIKRDCFPRGNIIYQNIQKANPLYQKYSKLFMDTVVSGELIGDKELYRETFGKTEQSDSK